MEILKVENLNKIYGKGENEVKAVNNISFSVQKGEFVAIVGASGSGKSTLLHLLGGVDRPTSGRVFIDGQDIYRLNDEQLAIFRRRQVGLIYQFYNLIPILNVEENITLPCNLDGKEVKLTPTEYNILKFLTKNKGKVFSIEDIYTNVWDGECYAAENVIAVHIRHIREKIEINPKEPKYLKVIWGIGYKVEAL